MKKRLFLFFSLDHNSIGNVMQRNDQKTNIWTNRYKEIYNYYSVSNFKRRMSVCSVFPLSRYSEFVDRTIVDKKKISNFEMNNNIIASKYNF